jgi:hypothetical protein
VLGSTEIRRRVDRKVNILLDVDGSPKAQAEKLDVFVEFGRGVVKGFAGGASKTAAQVQMLTIAQRVSAYADGHRRGARPTLPAPAPMTPRRPGDGKILTRDDWTHPTWTALAFAILGESDFSYAIDIEGPDTAVVRAVGDPDGDGDVSVFELHLTITTSGDIESSAVMVLNEG